VHNARHDGWLPGHPSWIAGRAQWHRRGANGRNGGASTLWRPGVATSELDGVLVGIGATKLKSTLVNWPPGEISATSLLARHDVVSSVDGAV